MASRGISCFITSPPGVDRPRPTRVDSRRGKKRKKRNERIHAPVDRRSREESGVVSFFLHYSRDVHLFPGLVDVAFSFRRLYAPTMDRRLMLKFRFCPRQFFFFSLYSRPATTLSHTPSLSIIDRKKFHVARETFSLSRVLLFDKARPRTGRLSFELPETAPSNGAKHIFPCSRSRFGLLSRRLGCSATSRCRDARKRGFPLGTRSQFTEELILLSTKRGREV